VGGSNKSKGRFLYAGGTIESLFRRLPLNSYVISHLRKHIAAGIGFDKGMKENDWKAFNAGDRSTRVVSS